tara:strand:+ start:401 stop:1090 length:690 start_codon:yes stop_codon:yes gene_type:complete
MPDITWKDVMSSAINYWEKLDEMKDKTIEEILPENVLALVRNAPSNRLTRGSVRAAINLVIPEVITTTEDMEQYIVANYDESKQVETEAEKAQRLRRERTLRIQEEARQRQEQLERDTVVSFRCDVEQREYGNASYACDNYYRSRIRITSEQISSCRNKSDVMDVLYERVLDGYEDEGACDSSSYDYDGHDAQDWGDREDETDYEQVWENNKERIAEVLGLTVEEMENE